MSSCHEQHKRVEQSRMAIRQEAVIGEAETLSMLHDEELLKYSVVIFQHGSLRPFDGELVVLLNICKSLALDFQFL